jgi:hypothetical protein
MIFGSRSAFTAGRSLDIELAPGEAAVRLAAQVTVPIDPQVLRSARHCELRRVS